MQFWFEQTVVGFQSELGGRAFPTITLQFFTGRFATVQPQAEVRPWYRPSRRPAAISSDTLAIALLQLRQQFRVGARAVPYPRLHTASCRLLPMTAPAPPRPAAEKASM